MGDALAHQVIDRYERAMSVERVGDGGCKELHRLEEPFDRLRRQIRQCFDVVLRDHERMAYEKRSMIEERDRVGILVNDMRRSVTFGDVAERTHEATLTVGECPPADIYRALTDIHGGGGAMDESAVRERADAHGQAVAAGDLNRAGGDLTKEAMAEAGSVMKALPRPVTGAEIESVESAGDGYVVLIRYSGADSDVKVRSRWVDDEGTPKIAELTLA
jgi:hypothetical protein